MTQAACTSNSLPSICRPGSRPWFLLLTTLFFALADYVASLVTCALMKSPNFPLISVGGDAPKTIRSNGFGFNLDDDTSDIVDSGGVTGNSRMLDHNDRRFFLSSLLASPLLGVTPAFAVKGAAEYDLEYYMRDLLMGNNREGNLPVSNAPLPQPPRKLQGRLLPLLLDDDLQSCVPILELTQISKIPISTLSEQIRDIRSKVQTVFKTAHPWRDELVCDEYYFDLTCYALWKTASYAIPLDYVRRDLFVRSIGRRLLNEMMNFLSKSSVDILHKNSPSLTDTVPCVIEILDVFLSSNYCTGYRLGGEDDDERTGLKVFDSLDDDEISSQGGRGGSVDCLVSIFNPATLGGSLQINGEGSRFAPDFIGPTLAAVWERVGRNGVVGVSFESYFVDPVYRPNPKDFFPNERLYQFTITRK